MARQTNWSDLRLGLAAITVVAALFAGILFFGRLGRIPGDTYRVFVRAEDARGIIRGSEVWLGGQKVGAVRRIELMPPSSGAADRLVLEIELMARHRQALRRDSPVEIRSGGSLIGAPVVSLGIGTPEAAVVAAGDTLRARAQVDMEGMTDRLAEATEQLPELVDNVGALMELGVSTDGTLGAFAHERGGADFAAARMRMGQIAARVRSERGTIGLALGNRQALMGRARLAMSRADSVQQLLRSPQHSLGRFRRDTTLAADVTEIRNELSIVRALLAEPRGTLGRVARDSAFVAGLASVERELGELLADVKRRPLRYLAF